jgi:DNA-binding transcriptional regulator YdaS (Cro superfamily)
VTPLQSWWARATTAERSTLAKALGTSTKYLSFYAQGRRQPGADRGIVIERETKLMNKASEGRLPVVYRTDVVPACRECEFARRCLGGARVEASAFNIVEGK